MSIWISKPKRIGTFPAFAVCGLLAACGGGRFELPNGVFQTGNRAQASMAVAGGDVIIAGPRGFCVDPGSSQQNASVPFVTLGNCASISGNSRAPQPGVKAVLTASVGPVASGSAVSGGTQTLDPFFRSAAGRKELSRDLNPNTVTIVDTFEEAGVFFLHLNDTSAGALPDIAPDQWRGYMDVNGRLVSASVLGFRDAPLSETQSRNLIRAFTREIRTKSAESTLFDNATAGGAATAAAVGASGGGGAAAGGVAATSGASTIGTVAGSTAAGAYALGTTAATTAATGASTLGTLASGAAATGSATAGAFAGGTAAGAAATTGAIAGGTASSGAIAGSTAAGAATGGALAGGAASSGAAAAGTSAAILAAPRVAGAVAGASTQDAAAGAAGAAALNQREFGRVGLFRRLFGGI